MKNLHAVVLGATGATGQELVRLLLENSNFGSVSIFVRRKPSIEHPKLTIYEIDFNRLNDYQETINGDVLFSALGTTLKDAGSKAQQYLVDHTYQFEFAKMAKENGVDHYSLVSSVGANRNSMFFYPKIKGELEESIKTLGFKRTHIFQPPTLIRQPNLMRASEKKGIRIFNFLNQIGILKSQKPLCVRDLATKMIEELLSSKTNGVTTYNSKYFLR